MCGIIGYVGKDRASPVLLEGLRSLEYRGYDSTGIATLDGNLHIRKFLGPVSSLASSDTPELPGALGIAHTRWATHGAVTIQNAHPHMDCSARVAVVHNGIIENAAELRESLSSRNHIFTSDTDTEIIPHLIEENIRKGRNLSRAVREASRRLEGSFAFLVLSTLDPNRLFACKNHLPLLVGSKPGCRVVSSDPASLPSGMNQITVLQDGDFAILGPKTLKISDISTGLPCRRQPEPIESFPRDLGMQGFRHYMEKEINEQPTILRRLARNGLGQFHALASSIQDANQVFLVGAGTSYHACLAASYLLNDIAGIASQPMLASSFSSFRRSADEDDLIVAVSQSGETADVLDSIRSVDNRDIPVFGLVNNPASSLARCSQASACIGAGMERGVAATKTYTAQLATFYLIAHEIAGELETARTTLDRHAKYLRTAMMDFRRFAHALAPSLFSSQLMVLIGRNIAFPTALEAALKIREISYIPSLGLEGAELKHGSLALIAEDVPCMVFAPKDDRAIMANAEEAGARGARLIGITESDGRDLFDDRIVMPGTEDLFPISAIIPAQMLSYEMAVLRGNDPDRPRNLAKCVTVR